MILLLLTSVCVEVLLNEVAMQARGLSFLPHNWQQIANYRSEHTRDQNLLYSVMLECEVAQWV